MSSSQTYGPRNIKRYLKMIEESRLLAPNLKECHFWRFRGPHKSNRTVQEVEIKHLLALRWMNPSALVYYRDSPDMGEARVTYELWNEKKGEFNVGKRYSADRVVAQLMFAARDPMDDEEWVEPESTVSETEAER